MNILKQLCFFNFHAIIYLSCLVYCSVSAAPAQNHSANPYTSKDVSALITLAQRYEEKQEWLQAASVYQRVLQLESPSALSPQSRNARRQFVFSLSRARAFSLAKTFANEYPAEFSEDEKYKLAHDDAALDIHFGEAQLAADNKPSRFNSIDVALIKNSDILHQYGERAPTEFDRLVALRDRGDMRAVVELYQKLVNAKLDVPSYAKFAVAGAYLYLEQPEISRDLYLDGLRAVGNDADTILEAQISLVYAYSEAGQYKEAEELANNLVAGQPQLLFKGMRGLEQDNPDYLRTYLIRTKLEENDDRLDLAEQHLQEVRHRAPFNNDIRLSWASLLTARDHPREGLDEYTLLQIDQPNLIEAAIGRGKSLLSLNEFAQSKLILPPLLDVYPENKAVHNFAEDLRNYGRPFYQIKAVKGTGSSHNGADSLYEASIYSAPLTNLLNDHFRALSQITHAQGEIDSNMNARRSRFDVGIDYRSRDIEAQALVSHTLNSPANTGIALNMVWNMSDTWRVGGGIDTNVIDLQARAIQEAITAKNVKLDLTWSKNESRKFGSEISRMYFSDSNVRDSGAVSWTERWVSMPVFKLNSLLYMGTSSNSALNRAYFNPLRDYSVSLDLDASWLNWQRYRRSFKQLAGITLGDYWQEDFGSGLAAGLRYGHEWRFEGETTLQYGMGRNFQPFDGVREYRTYFYLNLSGRI